MFGKAKCKLCNDKVRFALRHLNEKHPEVIQQGGGMNRAKMEKLIERYFVDSD
jgi:hypothetical protein